MTDPTSLPYFGTYISHTSEQLWYLGVFLNMAKKLGHNYSHRSEPAKAF